jgi:hypothetical protein
MPRKLDASVIRAAFRDGRVSREELEAAAEWRGPASIEKVAVASGLPRAVLTSLEFAYQVRDVAAELVAEQEGQFAAAAAQRARDGTLGYGPGLRNAAIVGGARGLPPLLGAPDARRTATVQVLLDDPHLEVLRRATARREPVQVAGMGYQRSQGPVTLREGAVVEGSIDHSGLQPHYVIDLSHPALRPLVDEAVAIGESDLTLFDKVEQVRQLVRQALPNRHYRNPTYLALLEAARTRGSNLSLGDYADPDIQAGVCREHAMLLNVLLSAAGIESYYAYTSKEEDGRVEDHAVCLLPVGEKTWVVDSYNRNFHGFLLKDLMKQGGTRFGDPLLPGANPLKYGRSIALAPFPVVWQPVTDA